jgi:glycosyltransferase involved in cell wall biosynthesis
LVEQDKHSKIAHLKLPVKHIFAKTNMPFNKSWGFNIGLKYVNNPIVVFTDCDLIMDPNLFIKGLKLLEEYDMVSPYNSVVDLNQNENNLPIDSILRISRPGRGETDIQKVPLCGGVCIFRRESIMKIAGWNEDFWSWGGEDDFQAIKVKNLLKWYEQPGRCYHLYHDREAPDMKLYQRNLQLLQSLSKFTKDELIKHISSTVQKIGMKNKCDNF